MVRAVEAQNYYGWVHDKRLVLFSVPVVDIAGRGAFYQEEVMPSVPHF
jgi:hypothetical protein